jgi:hypothetical protein
MLTKAQQRLEVRHVALPEQTLTDSQAMYRTISVVVLAVGLFGAADVAQSPSDDGLISRRSIKLTAEQEYVLRENVKNVRGGQVAQKFAPKVGEKIPPDVELHGFPVLVIDKIPQVKTFKFFVTKDQIVLVSPQKTVADVIRRR